MARLNMSKYVTAFAGAILGIVTAPLIATTVSDYASNFTGASLVIWNLMPLLYILIMVLLGLFIGE